MKSLYFIIIISILCAISFVVSSEILHGDCDHGIGSKNDHINFGYMSHYVKFHIYPEREGISVVAWASDEFPPTTGYTDNNSEVMFPMISNAKYSILIDNNRCSYYVYPVESYYNISCGDLNEK